VRGRFLLNNLPQLGSGLSRNSCGNTFVRKLLTAPTSVAQPLTEDRLVSEYVCCVDTNVVAVQRPRWLRTFGSLASSRATKRREQTCRRGTARSTSCTGSMDTSWQVCGVLTVPGAWSLGKYTVGLLYFLMADCPLRGHSPPLTYMHGCNLYW
jgi:hypothetical protein